jgi:asparagine synthase (glutamine-hydrolysing)
VGAILGQIEAQRPVDTVAFGRMLDTLVARGRDGGGTRALRAIRVVLGHRRIALLDDPTRDALPLGNEDGSVWLTCNGEIFNFRELRKELEAGGHEFRTTSDC